MTGLTAPPPAADVSTLIALMELVCNPKATAKALADLKLVSDQIHDQLRAVAEQTDAQTATAVQLNSQSVLLGQREAAVAQREIALRDGENDLAARLAALRTLVS